VPELTRRASRTTIHDVAKSAGVAIKTVSRVLNDEPNVSVTTRARVKAVVRALNYHPSLSARGLAGRGSYLIGLLYANPSANYVVDVQHGAMTRCREERFQLFVHQCGGQGAELAREVLGIVDQTNVDGLVITPPLSESEHLTRALDRRTLPFVRIAPNAARHTSPYVDMDDESAAREMTEYLIGLGHRRIAFIVGHPAHCASRRRLQGYRLGLRAHRIPFRADYVRQGYFEFESGLEGARELLALHEPPTAIFASNDDMAAGALVAAHEKGLTVPDRLSVAGFDDTYIARTVWPPLTTVHQPSYDLAYAATDLLLQQLKCEGARLPRPARLPYALVHRDSVGPVAARG
jgi:LacI family transcriptional regulator